MPYDHPINKATSLLQPLYSGMENNLSVIILLEEPSFLHDHPVNTARFSWPIVNQINGVPLFVNLDPWCNRTL